MESDLSKVLLPAALLLAACAALAALTHRLRQPLIVGYFLTGVLLGPHGLGWVSEKAQVEGLGELGVVFLLFLLGTELSLERLRPLLKPALVGGSLQIGVTIAAAVAMAFINGWGTYRGLFIGCILSLSSTAIAVKLLAASDQLRSPQGKFSLGVLLFQDLAVVPMMILLPAFSGAVQNPNRALLVAAGKALGFLALSFVAGRWVFPPILAGAARSRSQELFTLTVLALALGMAAISSLFSLSLAMGAFVAGLTLGQSPFSQKILADVLPFRDAFLSLFFVSTGMLLDPRSMADSAVELATLVGLIIALKTLVCAWVGRLLGLPRGMAIQAGLVLSQVGEFSFLLARMGPQSTPEDQRLQQVILSSSVVTMALTPILVRLGTAVSGWLSPPRESPAVGPPAPDPHGENLSDHVVIAGFGPVGQFVAEALRDRGIPFVAIELNPDTVSSFRQKGIPIIYGDARSEVLLDRVAISRARALVVAIPSFEIAGGVVRNVRMRRPGLPIYARAVFSTHLRKLSQAGASFIVHDEREAGRAILRELLVADGRKSAEIEELFERLERTESDPEK